MINLNLRFLESHPDECSHCAVNVFLFHEYLVNKLENIL